MSIFTGAGVALITPMNPDGAYYQRSDRRWYGCGYCVWNNWRNGNDDL